MGLYGEIDQAVRAFGMRLRGGFRDEESGMTHIMVGNVGSEIWGPFSATREKWEAHHPMDHWTRDLLTPLAEEYYMGVVYPFEGPEFRPFQAWALQSDTIFQSPIGYLIHPEFGLWHAYRATFLSMHDVDDLPERAPTSSPCETCVDKPCLTSCPVDAFSEGFYDVGPCVDHLTSCQEGTCMSAGCMARLSCPVGAQYRYGPELADFHMGQFLVGDLIR